MDLMAIRRRLMMQIKDYFDGIEWQHKYYIPANGKITKGNTTASYTLNPMFMKAGTYRLKGFNSFDGTIENVSTLNYRIHEYNSNDKWVKQVTYFPINTQSPVDVTFILDHDSYIRISLGKQYFTGTLTKIS